MTSCLSCYCTCSCNHNTINNYYEHACMLAIQMYHLAVLNLASFFNPEQRFNPKLFVKKVSEDSARLKVKIFVYPVK